MEEAYQIKVHHVQKLVADLKLMETFKPDAVREYLLVMKSCGRSIGRVTQYTKRGPWFFKASGDPCEYSSSSRSRAIYACAEHRLSMMQS